MSDKAICQNESAVRGTVVISPSKRAVSLPPMVHHTIFSFFMRFTRLQIGTVRHTYRDLRFHRSARLGSPQED